MSIGLCGTDRVADYIADGFALDVRQADHPATLNRQPAWTYTIFVNGRRLLQGSDLYGDGTAPEMISSLISFLLHDAEVYRTYMGELPDDHDGYVTSPTVAEWAYQVEDELSMIQIEIDERKDK